MEKARVRDYMTTDVVSLPADMLVRDAIVRIAEESHVGLPVTEENRLVGFLTPKELLRHLDETDARIGDIIAPGTVVAHPDMSLEDAARVLFRIGVKELPVVDDEGIMVGIISTTDVIRSHIERVTPSKLEKLKATLEALYDVEVTIVRKTVAIEGLLPTQKRIYGDELEGRMIELKRRLAEPILVVEKEPQNILVDGHHRVVAAQRLGLDALDAFILQMDRDIELGMERNARAAGLHVLDDVEILDSAQHPLVEITTRMMKDKTTGVPKQR